MTQTRDEIEQWYRNPDPWGYKVNPDDLKRKNEIIWAAKQFGSIEGYRRALDIGAGEGWITKDLPAEHKYGYELSAEASMRFPKGVTRVTKPVGPYDLVIATGVLYAHYDWPTMVGLINKFASNVVVLCNIKEWEVPEAIAQIEGKQVYATVFPYREYIQHLRVFRRETTAPDRSAGKQ